MSLRVRQPSDQGLGLGERKLDVQRQNVSGSGLEVDSFFEYAVAVESRHELRRKRDLQIMHYIHSHSSVLQVCLS